MSWLCLVSCFQKVQHVTWEGFYRIGFQDFSIDTRSLCHVWFSVCSLRLFLCLALVFFMCLCVCVDSDPTTQSEVGQYLCPLLWPKSIIHVSGYVYIWHAAEHFHDIEIISASLWSVCKNTCLCTHGGQKVDLQSTRVPRSHLRYFGSSREACNCWTKIA